MRYASKVDTTHAEIRDGLRAIFGPDTVQDTSMYPRLGFDLIARRGDGPPMFLEVKQPKKATRLTESEIAARERYGRYWRVVATLDEALSALEAML